MDTSLASTSTPTPPPPAPPTATPATSPQPRRQRHAGHIVAIVIGCLMLLPALGMMAGGGATALGQAVATDDDGYFRFTLDRAESDGVAIATTDLFLDDDIEGDAPAWLFDLVDFDLRLRVDGAASTDDVFVGIARSADVEQYLAGTAYSEVVELDGSTPRYVVIDGDETIEPPSDQDIWTVSASGAGEQELIWDARSGHWSVVVMNADGSPVVATDVELGARVGALMPIAMTLMVLGGIGFVAAVVLIVVGARGRRAPERDEAPLEPPTPDTAARLDDELTV